MGRSAPKQVKEGKKMKNQLFALLVVVMALGFTITAYSETTVSLQPTTDITTAAVGARVEIDIKITGGKGVAGYGPLVAFNILDLVFVDGKFGQPVVDANRAADVNADGKINIQDLVLIAQHLGN